MSSSSAPPKPANDSRANTNGKQYWKGNLFRMLFGSSIEVTTCKTRLPEPAGQCHKSDSTGYRNAASVRQTCSVVDDCPTSATRALHPKRVFRSIGYKYSLSTGKMT